MLIANKMVSGMPVKKKLSASLEDYLEAIYNLSREPKVARSRDIAQNLGVSRASVTGALKLLSDKGLVNYKPYGYITLTDKGAKEAQLVVNRHNIIKSFFVNVLGVEQQIAAQAACRAEHVLGPVVISRLLDFSDFAARTNENGNNLTHQFTKFRKRKLQNSNSHKIKG